MDLQPTDEQRQIRDAVREYVAAEVAPGAAGRDRDAGGAVEALRALRDLGLPGALAPEAAGGAGLDLRAMALAVEEIAAADGSLALALAWHAAGAVGTLVAADATDGLEALALARDTGTVVQGDLAATPEGDGWRLTGEARFVPLGTSATRLVALARSDDGPVALRVDAVPTVTGRPSLLGLRSAGVVHLAFEGAPARRLGGDAVAGRVRDVLDVMTACLAVGLGRGALEQGRDYAVLRRQFGQPIGELAAIQHKLADMATGLETARLLAWRAAWRLDEGRRAPREAAMARLAAGRAAVRATDEALQIHGGYGYTREFPVERLWRDARVAAVLGGGEDGARDAVAAEVLAATRA